MCWTDPVSRHCQSLLKAWDYLATHGPAGQFTSMPSWSVLMLGNVESMKRYELPQMVDLVPRFHVLQVCDTIDVCMMCLSCTNRPGQNCHDFGHPTLLGQTHIILLVLYPTTFHTYRIRCYYRVYIPMAWFSNPLPLKEMTAVQPRRRQCSWQAASTLDI